MAASVLSRSVSESLMMYSSNSPQSSSSPPSEIVANKPSALDLKKRFERTGTMNADETSDSAMSDSGGDEELSVQNQRAKPRKQRSLEVSDVDEPKFTSPRGGGPRRISIIDPKSKATNCAVIKEGNILKHTRTFGRWVKRFCTIDNRKLFLRKSEDDKLSEEFLLKDATVVESSAQNVNHGFMIMTPYHTITLAAYSRKELEEWMSAVKQAALSLKNIGYLESAQHLDGQHSWFTCSHPRPTYCNVCGDTLNGVAWHGLSCEVCKFKSHRRCVFNVTQKCKWTTRANIENLDNCAQLPNAAAALSIPHQWTEGNLPTGSKCIMCTKNCGSVKRLQDYRCLWCKQTVHADCKNQIKELCAFGSNSSCVLPPSAVKRSNEVLQGMWEPYKLSSCSSPVLAFVNSKSGDNKGVRFLRRLKYWLNPLQVFDLAISGPEPGLQLFQRLDQFRVLVFGGDGSIGWVLSTIDKLHLHSKCIVGVVPLGTGNDLARVLGWGSQFSDEDKIPSLLGEMENSRVQLLDRWSLGFTKDTSFSVSTLQKKTHNRTHSTSSFDARSFNGGSSSPLNIQTQHQQSQTSTANSVSDCSVESLSPEPQPCSQLLRPAHQQIDSLSVNSSTSSCGYHTALSRSPSGGSISDKMCEDTNQNFNTAEKPFERTLTGSQEKLTTQNKSDVDIREEKLEDENSSECVNQHVKTLDSSHIVVVTPPQDSFVESSKWVGSLQESITSHLSTILLSENDEQVVLSSQVLCEVVKQFITSLQSQQSQKLSSNQFEEDPLMKKCTVLNEKLQSLTKTLNEEITAGGRIINDSNSDESEQGNKKKDLKVFQPRKTIMSRANSLKKAIESILDTTEKAIDAQERIPSSTDRLTSTGTVVTTNMLVASSQDQDTAQTQRLVSPDPTPRVKSPLLTAESTCESTSLPSDFHEIACMNNYFGLGLDAKITYEFHTRREENPSQYKNRAKNMILYGYLGGREFFTNTQKRIERKLTLECDGKPVQLPQKLQGLVFLNIPSYMAGTNFWGTEKEKEGFSAPSMDDKLLEVVGITGFSHLATTKVLGIQNQRLAQCRYAKVVVHSEMPMQVDGEAKMQQPGTITITHKNKARVIVKDKLFTQSLETWSKGSSQNSKRSGPLPVTTLLLDALTVDEIASYQDISVAVNPLIQCIQLESEMNHEVTRDLMPRVTTAKTCLDRVFPITGSVSETADLEHLQDMESSVKSLIQETLWFLDMDKILPDRENDMRSLVVSLELKVKKVILSQHSTRTLAHRGQRTISDSAVMLDEVLSNRPPLSNLPATNTHRERSTQIGESKAIANSRLASNCIGKEIMGWDNDDVCYWLKAIELGDHVATFKENQITGTELVNMTAATLQNFGISKPGHQMRFTQCLRILKQPKGFSTKH